MVIVPTSITALVYPAQSASRTHPCCPAASKAHENFDTIKVTPGPSNQFYPNISFQPLFPDTDERYYWPTGAWKDRAVVGGTKYHVLFTTSQDSKLRENRHAGGKVRGDIFVLKLSDMVDENKRRFYVDMVPGEWDPEKVVWEDLVEDMVKVQRARGH